MSYCKGSVRIGQTTNSIGVLFSSGAGSSYISELRISDINHPTTVEESPVIIEGASGRQSTCTHTASVDLTLEKFRHVVDVLVVPGEFPYLVLGMDWFAKYKPRIDWSENSILITGDGGVKHNVQLEDKDSSSEVLLLPSMRVVGRVELPPPQVKDKTTKPFSRYKTIKENWGNRVNFQLSFNLGMDYDDIQEGNRILEAMEKHARMSSESEK